MSEKMELKPCPFCGEQPSILKNMGTIFCGNDNCFGPQSTAEHLEDSAVQWNTRVSSPMKAIEDCVISAACRLIEANIYVHPTLTRENAVNAATAELYEAVGKWHGSQPAKAAITSVEG